MQSSTYKNASGQTIELFEGSNGFVTVNQETKDISVHYKDSESCHGAPTLEIALCFIVLGEDSDEE
jgi:hypothetical protein